MIVLLYAVVLNFTLQGVCVCVWQYSNSAFETKENSKLLLRLLFNTQPRHMHVHKSDDNKMRFHCLSGKRNQMKLFMDISPRWYDILHMYHIFKRSTCTLINLIYLPCQSLHFKVATELWVIRSHP